MSKTKIAVFSCALSLAAATYAAAQEPAVLLLRSGERVRGELVDMGADFTMNVNGQERRLPVNDVLVIDFVGGAEGLPATETGAVPADRHLIVLRGSGSAQGWLKDIAGTRPLQLTFATDSGERTYNSGEVGRIYLGRRNEWAAAPPAVTTPPVVATTGEKPAPLPAPNQGPAPGAMAIMGNQPWTPTNIFVREGDMVTFTSSGQVRLGGDADDLAAPAGSLKGRTASNAPLPAAPAGILIARIGNTAPFAIGSDRQVRMPASGELFLGINDDGFGDNAGQFDVAVSSPNRRRR